MWFWISFLLLGMVLYLPVAIIIWCIIIVPLEIHVGNDRGVISTGGFLVLVTAAILFHGGLFGWYRQPEPIKSPESSSEVTSPSSPSSSDSSSSSSSNSSSDSSSSSESSTPEKTETPAPVTTPSQPVQSSPSNKSNTSNTCTHYEYGQCWDEIEERAYDAGSQDAYYGGHSYYEGCTGVCEDIYDDAYDEGYWDYGGYPEY